MIPLNGEIKNECNIIRKSCIEVNLAPLLWKDPWQAYLNQYPDYLFSRFWLFQRNVGGVHDWKRGLRPVFIEPTFIISVEKNTYLEKKIIPDKT